MDNFKHRKGSTSVAHWQSISGDHGSNPGGEKTNSSFIFELPSHDCHLTSNEFMIIISSLCHVISILRVGSNAQFICVKIKAMVSIVKCIYKLTMCALLIL